MKVFTLNGDDLTWLQDSAEEAARMGMSLVIAFDPVDKVIKVKDHGRWSPPLGVLEIDD